MVGFYKLISFANYLYASRDPRLLFYPFVHPFNKFKYILCQTIFKQNF